MASRDRKDLFPGALSQEPRHGYALVQHIKRTSNDLLQVEEGGYRLGTMDALVRLRDHGVTAERIKRANEKAGTKLPLDMVRSLVDAGCGRDHASRR